MVLFKFLVVFLKSRIFLRNYLSEEKYHKNESNI